MPADRPVGIAADAVVLAGDTDLRTAAINWADSFFAELPVLYIQGNHEGYGHHPEELQGAIAETCEASARVHCLNRRELALGGVRLFGRHAVDRLQALRPRGALRGVS